MMSPNDWSFGVPASCHWVADVKKLGDNTWDVIEVHEDYDTKLPTANPA